MASSWAQKRHTGAPVHGHVEEPREHPRQAGFPAHAHAGHLANGQPRFITRADLRFGAWANMRFHARTGQRLCARANRSCCVWGSRDLLSNTASASSSGQYHDFYCAIPVRRGDSAIFSADRWDCYQFTIVGWMGISPSSWTRPGTLDKVQAPPYSSRCTHRSNGTSRVRVSTGRVTQAKPQQGKAKRPSHIRMLSHVHALFKCWADFMSRGGVVYTFGLINHVSANTDLRVAMRLHNKMAASR